MGQVSLLVIVRQHGGGGWGVCRLYQMDSERTMALDSRDWRIYYTGQDGDEQEEGKKERKKERKESQGGQMENIATLFLSLFLYF
jgi:hypothetical protein